MCGILGYTNSNIGIKGKLEQLRISLNRLAHRGPDAYGEFYSDQVYLGHRRLSIIDLSNASNQPFKSFKFDAYIVFNGEIYNYKELSSKLDGLSTASDTEVILEGYLRYGYDFFKELRGIYSFAIYDFRNSEKLLLYRDLAGVKPLYYYNVNGVFAFASEIKAIRGLVDLSISDVVLKSYLGLGYCIEPKTIFNEIKTCEPGQCIEYDINSKRINSFILKRYLFNRTNNLTFEENKQQTKCLLAQAIRRNLVADVAVSISLSGGIDSSLIAAYSKDFNGKLIAIKFSDVKYDESEIAKAYANHLNLQIEVINVDDFSGIEVINDISLHFDQPFSDTSSIPFYFLAREASKYGKVLLGGDGGDEIHNGYSSYGWMPLLWKNRTVLNLLLQFSSILNSNGLERKLSRARKMLKQSNIDNLICEWNCWMPPSTKFQNKSIFNFNSELIYKVFNESFRDAQSNDVGVNLVSSYFQKRMLSDYLRKTDCMSMLNGLEYRVPFLDEDLVEFSLSIPYSQKSNIFQQKRILRSIHADLYPGKYHSRKKSGFGIPLDKWLSDKDFKLIESNLIKKGSIVSEYINHEYIKFLFKALIDDSYRKYISRSAVYQRIIQMYSLELFCEKKS